MPMIGSSITVQTYEAGVNEALERHDYEFALD